MEMLTSPAEDFGAAARDSAFLLQTMSGLLSAGHIDKKTFDLIVAEVVLRLTGKAI